MKRSFRNLLFIVAIVQAISGIAFALQAPFVTQLWHSLLPGATPLSLTFAGSIFAAAAASTLWCLMASTEDGALAGIALDYLVIFFPMSLYIFQMATTEGNSSLLVFAALCALGVVFGAILYFLTRNIPIRDMRPQPRLVRLSFGFFILALVVVGGAMVLRVPNVMPWPISTDESVIYGWMFLGAATYFAYSLLRPSWANSAGQLAGFLAYDLVLIIPFLARFGAEIPQQFMFGHLFYTAVVIFSGALAIYYLFLNPETRLSRQRALPSAAT
jgi:hypothetical protein